MTDPESDELQVLRERAYGPAADIHLDSKALHRLYELEGRGEEPEAMPATEAHETPVEVAPPPAPEESAPVTDEAEAHPAQRRPAFRMRRSTFLIALALVALIVVTYAALELVQRVQADPLQVGASQVARLSEDDTYEIPAMFSNTFGREEGAQAFQDFYGLRAIISSNGTETDDKCIVVFPSDGATDSDGNFSGGAYGGCAAGAFPAAVAFRVTPGLPERLRNEFSDGTALQFVLDGDGNEIVVFADR